MTVRKQIRVSGIVQGVGFRPYIYRLAANHGLAGHISNTAAGVTIEVQGESQAVEGFLDSMPRQAPPLARITDVRVAAIASNGDRHFHILASEKSAAAQTLIAPDVAVCADCLRELFDRTDRRYGYPFINCTNCGPRFTIVRSLPYDRPSTSMAVFPMCARCQEEYDDPLNRRFHAQPNACWECGPRMELWDHQRLISRDNPIPICFTPRSLVKAGEHLRAGAILAVKGLGGFHLAVDATNAAAVRRLRERKHRFEKPLAVMVPNLEAAHELTFIEKANEDVLLAPPHPITLLERKPACAVAPEVAPGHRELGIFLPYTPLHHLLFAESKLQALVMTSGNLSEEPIAIDNDEARARLSGIADFFFMHNREILLRCDDSVVRPVAGRVRHLRRSRGFVPVPVSLKQDLPPALAVGGELKNTICILKGHDAFLSQHIGDLENAESYAFFQEVIEHLQKILEVQPRILAYDLHPDYLSTKWALQQKGLRLVGIQHHHAHIASCMAENGLTEKAGRVIGLALDGTGYGADGRIWGGEVLIADYCDFERAAHFKYVPMPGGEAAIREPWRMALSYLWQRFGREAATLPLPLVRDIPEKKIENLMRMIERGICTPLTSSCGRLFDAVAALVGLRHRVNCEAQAAIELELCRDAGECGTYAFSVIEEGGICQIDAGPVIAAVVEDVIRQVSGGVISQRFHNAVSNVLIAVTARLRQRTGLNRVCLSGGTFQNVYLATELERRLREKGFEVFTHSEVPANDGGLSFGQAMIAAYRTIADKSELSEP
jgi:hydrogenase maturation protein HypF